MGAARAVIRMLSLRMPLQGLGSLHLKEQPNEGSQDKRMACECLLASSTFNAT
jgi:hypothetical protein